MDWSALASLLPLINDVLKPYANGELDLHSAVNQASQRLTGKKVEDLAADAVKDKASSFFHEGLQDAFSDDDLDQLTSIFSNACASVMTCLAAYVNAANGKTDEDKRKARGALKDGIAGVIYKSTDDVQDLVREELGIPADDLGDIPACLVFAAISQYCFAGAYRIYQTAAQDAALAHEHRIEIERLSREAVTEFAARRKEMEEAVHHYLLDRLEPFAQSMAAMDKALLDDDDDGFIASNAELWALFGREAQFSDAAGFDELMQSDEPFRL